MTVTLLLDGYKAVGEGAHKKLIEYLESHYNQFNSYEIKLIDDLRIVRNKIAYDGFFVREDYIERKIRLIHSIIEKLEIIIKEKLVSSQNGK